MLSIPILKQDFKINDKRLLIMYGMQLFCILLAVGICEMKLIEISDIFWDTIPVIVIPMILEMLMAYEALTERMEDGTMEFILATATKSEKVLFTKFVFIAGSGILSILLAAVIGSVTKVYRLSGYWTKGSYLSLCAGACCLQFFLSAYFCYIACAKRGVVSYVRFAVGIPIAMYGIYLAYYLVPRLFFLQYITVFSLFRQNWFYQKFFGSYIGMGLFLAAGAFFYWRCQKEFCDRI